jgi:2-polyprenyl-3-methyl-5-hydroxy-6-metoxy-1,4-benzoquinol methylase
VRDKDDFQARRIAARKEVNALDNAASDNEPKRESFFNMVYDRAEGDGAQVPWADFAPKPQLSEWLANNPAANSSQRAADVACGLGDHAEAMAVAGYDTVGFDIADTAINWAKERFPDTNVNFTRGDLFELQDDWVGSFDLVYECYTIQAVPEALHEDISKAIASLVATGGTLLIIARTRAEEEPASGPPWHLSPKEVNIFKGLGFELESESIYEVTRADKSIPHVFCVWKRT